MRPNAPSEGPAQRLMSLLQADPLLGQRAQIIKDVVQ